MIDIENIKCFDLDILALANDIYSALLLHPHDSWRIHNQRVLCDARNLICLLTGEDGQSVQERFELIAMRKNGSI